MSLDIEKYSEIYKRVLSGTMAENSPYDRLIKKLDEYYEKFALNDSKRIDTITATLSQATQSITLSSQDIAVRLMMESDRLEAELAQIAANTALIEAQKALAQAELPIKAEELALAKMKLELAQKEAKFNEERAKLIEKQALSEEARKVAIERETQSFDERLRIQKATLLKDSVFGYTAGALNPPADMITKMLNSIDAITPNA